MGLSYTDAVLLVGGRNNRTVVALDRLTGGALLAAPVAGGGFVLNLFEAKGELHRGRRPARGTARPTGVFADVVAV